MIHTPSAENTVTCGNAPSVGATMIVTKAARPIFTRSGSERLPEHRRGRDQRENAHERPQKRGEPGVQLRVGDGKHGGVVVSMQEGQRGAQLTSVGMLVSVWRR